MRKDLNMLNVTENELAGNGFVAEPDKGSAKCRRCRPVKRGRYYPGLVVGTEYEWPSRFWTDECRSDFEDKFDMAWLVAALQSEGFDQIRDTLLYTGAEFDAVSKDRIRELVYVLSGLGSVLTDRLESIVQYGDANA